MRRSLDRFLVQCKVKKSFKNYPLVHNTKRELVGKPTTIRVKRLS